MDFVTLPKIELHAHFTGSISRRTLHEIWLRKKGTGETDLEDPLVVMPEGKTDYNLETFFPLFSSYIYNLLTDEASIRYAAQAVLADFHADGVVYLELRTTPRATPSLSADAYVALLVDAICAFEADNPALHTRLILTIDRRHDLPTAEAIVDTALRHRPRSAATPGVVGIDLAGLPSAKPGGAVRELAPAFRRARQADGLGLTVHFAEDEASGTRAELDELLSWEPDRLGHVIWEDDEVKAEIARRGLCLELNLSCNVKAGMVKGGFEGHHFGAWRHVKGPTIALGTDDVGIFESPLSNEYRLVAQHFQLDQEAVFELARQPIDGIFAGDEEKQRLRDIMWT